MRAPVALGPGLLENAYQACLAQIHRARRLSHVTLGGYRLGDPLNFNVPIMRNGIIRIVSNL
jgi:hypothetical protein